MQYTPTRSCMPTSPSKSILPLSNAVERRTIETAEEKDAAVGSKARNMKDEVVYEKETMFGIWTDLKWDNHCDLILDLQLINNWKQQRWHFLDNNSNTHIQ